MVHTNEKTNKVVVIGVLYKIGKPDPFLSKARTFDCQIYIYWPRPLIN